MALHFFVSQLSYCGLQPELDVTNIFDRNPADPVAGKRYRIRGIISYYLQHYAAYFYNDKEKIWFSFDDVSVQPIGPSWKDVIRKCRMGHAKPVLIFYEETASTASSDQEASPVVRSKHRTIRHFRSFNK